MPSPALTKAVHAAARAAGMDDDTYRDVLERVSGHRSSAKMTDAQIRAALDAINGTGARPAAPGRAKTGHARMVRALWISLHHLGEVTDPSESALRVWVKRQHGVEDLRFVRATDSQAVIEGLKAWAARAGVNWAKWDKLIKDRALSGRRAVLDAQWAILAKAGAAPAIDLSSHVYGVIRKPSLAFAGPAEMDKLIADLGPRVRTAKASEGVAQ